MRQQCGERAGRHAFDARGLAECDRARVAELLAHFVRETADSGVIEIGRDAQIFVALEGFDVERLAFEVA